MRLFLAIGFDAQQEYLKSIQKELAEIPFTSLRPAIHFHLTLKFLGNVSKQSLLTILQVLPTLSFESFLLHLSDIGLFQSHRFPRIIWLGVHPHEPLIDLSKKIDQLLLPNFPPEKFFIPHITLARVKDCKIPEILSGRLAKIAVKPLSVLFWQLTLYQSTLTPQGPIYQELLVVGAKRKS